MWDQLVATRLDAKQHWSISKCQKHVPTPDRKLFCANMGNVLLFYVNKQILIFQYFFILSEPLLELQANYDYLKKLFTILHTIARLLLRVYALAFVHYIVDLRNSNCYCLLTMNRRSCCRKKLRCLFANWYSRPFISIVIWPLRKDIYTLHKDNWNAKIYDSLR